MFQRRYDKKYILLKEERSGYANGERNMAASCMIEIREGRGKCSVHVEGIRPLSLAEYQFYLICAGTEVSVGICMAVLKVDKEGKGELKFSFDPENVGGSGHTIDEVNTAAIVCVDRNKESKNVIAPLVGYLEEKINWKSNFREWNLKNESSQAKKKEIDEKKDSACEAIEEKNVTKKEETPKEEPNRPNAKESSDKEKKTIPKLKDSSAKKEKEVLETNSNEEEKTTKLKAASRKEEKETKKPPLEEGVREEDFYKDFHIMEEDTVHNTFYHIAKKFQKELKELEEMGIVLSNGTKGQKDTQNNNGNPPKEEKTPMEEIMENHQRIYPFGKEDKDSWVSLELEEVSLLPVKDICIKNHSMIVLCDKKYHHVILGRKMEEGKENYVLGIPDQYQSAHQQTANGLGFASFCHCPKNEDTKEEYGYWLMEL